MANLEPARILARAVAVMGQLRTSSIWQPSLDGASVTLPPLFVTSLVEPVEPRGEQRKRLPDYYIVSISREGGGISARFAHNAETGEFLEGEGVNKIGASFKTYVDPVQIARSRIPDLPPGTLAMDAVWKPCRQSTTRFLPFWRFRIQDRAVYVRADGQVFNALTTDGRG